jgi:hypothetical protein
MGAVDSSAAFLMAADQRKLWDRVNAAERRAPVEPIGAALLARFADRAEQTAVIAAGTTLTYRELAERAWPRFRSSRCPRRCPSQPDGGDSARRARVEC